MASITSVIVHNRLCYELARGNANWESDTWRAALFLKDTWTPNVDDDFVQTAITAGADELSGGGYARVTLSSKSTSLDDTNDRALLDCAEISFGAVAAGGAQDDYDTLVIYRFVTNDTDSWLAFTYSFDAVQTTNGTAITVAPNTLGIAQIT